MLYVDVTNMRRHLSDAQKYRTDWVHKAVWRPRSAHHSLVWQAFWPKPGDVTHRRLWSLVVLLGSHHWVSQHCASIPAVSSGLSLTLSGLANSCLLLRPPLVVIPARKQSLTRQVGHSSGTIPACTFSSPGYEVVSPCPSRSLTGSQEGLTSSLFSRT